MKIEKFHVYLADLNPVRGTEPGKVRPVVVVQTDMLNNAHASTVICPMTSQVTSGASLLRVHVKKKESGSKADLDILIDQIRAIDNRRFVRHLGKLPSRLSETVLQNLHVLLIE